MPSKHKMNMNPSPEKLKLGAGAMYGALLWSCQNMDVDVCVGFSGCYECPIEKALKEVVE